MSVTDVLVGRKRRPATKAHKIAVKVYLLLAAAVVVAAAVPVRNGSLRLALVGGIFALWTGALFLFWDRLTVRFLCLALTVGAGSLLLLPARAIDTNSLRAEYVRSLQSYQGTIYLWGGETHLGIDCSGLIRAGLIDAETKEGIRTRNVVLLRKAASLWWNDASAKAMREEYQGRTHKLVDFGSLNAADYAPLQPGDLAVIDNGQHILAYTGNKTWIEADPKVMKVVSVQAPSDSGWFVQHVTLLRWRVLEPSARAAEPQ